MTMINPRTSPELWNDDDEEFDAPLHYPNATRRRAIIAHSLGVVGVLGTLALGVAALAPHLSYLENRAHALFAPHPAQLVARPTAPVLVTTPVAALLATVESTPTAAPEAAPPPVAPLPVPVEPPVATEQSTAPESASPAPSEPAPVAAAPVATESKALAPTDEEPKANAPTAASDKPARAAATYSSRSRTEPRLTWGEIERRRARYDAWLQSQGLEPVH